MKPKDSSRNPCTDNTSGTHADDLALPLAQDKMTDTDLAHLVAAWPTLPQHIKAAILALAATGG
jgi:hypothetical protein